MSRNVQKSSFSQNFLQKPLLNEYKNQSFSHIETIIRNIPNKRMPSKNSPTNVTGQKEETMNNEYIVIMRKE